MSRITNPTVSAQKLVEDEKALYASSISPMSFKAYRTNFFFGRALGLEKECCTGPEQARQLFFRLITMKHKDLKRINYSTIS